MSKFRAAFEEGMIVRARLETEAVARRRAILENPDPTLLEQAKMWVNSELPDLIKRATIFGYDESGWKTANGVELLSFDIPNDYLYLACKDIPELVVSEVQYVFNDPYTSKPEMGFAYYALVRYPLS